MIKEFKGKVAVVTGAAHGIGFSLSSAFAKRGMKVVLADIDENALIIAAQELRKTSNDILWKVTDVSNSKQVEELADFSYKHFENVNILCNNAGICHSAPLQQLSKKDWDWVFGVNFYGVIHGINSFINRMLESNAPCHIVNTSSINGLYFSDMAPYDVTKHAITSLSEVLSVELSETSVGVSVLCPAWVKTDLVKTTENLGKQQSEISVLTPEILKSFNLDRETLDNLFDSGMNPDIVAELVIKAIQENIFYIVTHPENMQLVQKRFDKILEDSMKLNQK